MRHLFILVDAYLVRSGRHQIHILDLQYLIDCWFLKRREQVVWGGNFDEVICDLELVFIFDIIEGRVVFPSFVI